jgi:phytoene dehydrogenase-like protein
MATSYDAVIIGSGHNGLVAACYLALAGKKVLILEKNEVIGGATTSVQAFDGVPARLSRYSYLVALLPDQIIQDLSLNFKTLSRTVSSYTPYFDDDGDKGVLINRSLDEETLSSLRTLTGSDDESIAWKNFYESVLEFARVVAPTMLSPLPTESEIRELVDPLTWVELVENTLAETLHDNFFDDLIKGVVLTDGLIGTFTSANDHAANICFIYHLIGNGTGEWKVPEGGMGTLVDELHRRCQELGVDIKTGIEAEELVEENDGVCISGKSAHSQTRVEVRAKVALANCSPQVLEKISGIKAPGLRDGSQLKINMVLRELPQLKSGDDPRKAFAGTFHINESYFQLESAFEAASRGKIPTEIPAEMYCHTLTDASILSPELAAKGFHTLTLFALHTPAALFDQDHDAVKEEVTKRTLAGLNDYLIKPIESYLAMDAHGKPCIEVKTPQELEMSLGLPRGNIFHGDLQFPWKSDDDQRVWGVETPSPRIFIAGSGAVRGGGVSGIPGHNAAKAALTALETLK